VNKLISPATVPLTATLPSAASAEPVPHAVACGPDRRLVELLTGPPSSIASAFDVMLSAQPDPPRRLLRRRMRLRRQFDPPSAAPINLSEGATPPLIAALFPRATALPARDARAPPFETEAGSAAHTATPTAATAASAETTAATLLALFHFTTTSHTSNPATTRQVTSRTTRHGLMLAPFHRGQHRNSLRISHMNACHAG
jgi:hypothetical protein